MDGGIDGSNWRFPIRLRLRLADDNPGSRFTIQRFTGKDLRHDWGYTSDECRSIDQVYKNWRLELTIQDIPINCDYGWRMDGRCNDVTNTIPILRSTIYDLQLTDGRTGKSTEITVPPHEIVELAIYNVERLLRDEWDDYGLWQYGWLDDFRYSNEIRARIDNGTVRTYLDLPVAGGTGGLYRQ